MSKKLINENIWWINLNDIEKIETKVSLMSAHAFAAFGAFHSNNKTMGEKFAQMVKQESENIEQLLKVLKTQQ